MNKALGITAEDVIKEWMGELVEGHPVSDETALDLEDPKEIKTRDAICDWLMAVSRFPDLDFYLVFKRWLDAIVGHYAAGACVSCKDRDAMMHYFDTYRRTFLENPTPWAWVATEDCMIPRDYTTRTVDGARAHAAQFAEPEPVELLDGGDFPPGWEAGEPEEPGCKGL